MSDSENKLKQLLIDNLGLFPNPKDNRILSTTQFHMLYFMNNKLTMNSLLGYSWSVQNVLDSLQYVPGLYLRTPSAVDEVEQHDDYIAISCLGKLYGLKTAEDIDDYGRNHRYWPFNYWYDQRNPKQSIFTKEFWRCKRQGCHVAIFRALSDRYVGIINLLWFYGMVYFACKEPHNEVSSKLLLWMCNYFLKDRFGFKWIFKYYRNKMEFEYGRYWQWDLLNIYYPNDERFKLLSDYAWEVLCK